MCIWKDVKEILLNEGGKKEQRDKTVQTAYATFCEKEGKHLLAKA